MLPPKATLAKVQLASEIVIPRDPQQSDTTLRHGFDLEGTPLTKDQKSKASKMLNRMSYVFAKGDHDLGCAEEIEHEIRLTDKIPVREPYRKVPQGQLEEFRTAVKDLLDAGVIRESKSPYASPVVLAVAKLVVMLVMLSMTKHFLKMYVFLFAFIYFILFFNWDFFYISDILMHDIFGYFRIFRF